MEWLNYHHLLYFWAVARYGSVARAGAELHLSQPTISGQVHRLEDVLGEKLFERSGRRLALTAVGRGVFRYADEIFSLGRDLMGMLKGRPSDRPLRFTVGVADALPRVLAQKLIEPAFEIEKPIHLVCREDRVVEDFLSQLTGQELDLVLADRPLGPGIRANAFNHLLGESGTTFLAGRSSRRACGLDFRVRSTMFVFGPCWSPSSTTPRSCTRSASRDAASFLARRHSKANFAAATRSGSSAARRPSASSSTPSP